MVDAFTSKNASTTMCCVTEAFCAKVFYCTTKLLRTAICEVATITTTICQHYQQVFSEFSFQISVSHVEITANVDFSMRCADEVWKKQCFGHSKFSVVWIFQQRRSWVAITTYLCDEQICRISSGQLLFVLLGTPLEKHHTLKPKTRNFVLVKWFYHCRCQQFSAFALTKSTTTMSCFFETCSAQEYS